MSDEPDGLPMEVQVALRCMDTLFAVTCDQMYIDGEGDLHKGRTGRLLTPGERVVWDGAMKILAQFFEVTVESIEAELEDDET